jgi:hypothetical protein
MTALQLPDLPVPAGATADEWEQSSPHPDDCSRLLKYWSAEVDGLEIEIEGMQWASGEVDHQILLSGETWMTITGERGKRIAALLRQAADVIEQIGRTSEAVQR